MNGLISFARRPLAAALLACAALLCAGVAAPAAEAARAARSTTVVLPAPSAGDITYAQAQVTIGGKASRSRARGRSVVFTSSVGGLSVLARSGSWSNLRRDTRVNVVVTAVKGANAHTRNVTFFIYRRLGVKHAAKGATVTFSIANAVPAKGSFWVRSVNRRGVATIFTVRNSISTALGNWSRYLGALKAVRALRAAFHPRDVNGEFARSGGATARAAAVRVAGRRVSGAAAKSTRKKPPGGLNIAGSHIDARALAVVHLIYGTLGDRLAFQAAKRSTLADDFIRVDLHNPALAKRYRQVVDQLPAKIPDTYAAAAQQEARFSHIRAPLISRYQVVIADKRNAASQAAIETPETVHVPAPGQRVIVHLTGSGSGTVTGNDISCPGVCSLFYGGGQTVSLRAIPAAGSTWQGWQGCTAGTSSAKDNTVCELRIPKTVTSKDLNLYAQFDAGSGGRAQLTVSLPGSGSGTVTSQPPGISCPPACGATFPIGTQVNLRAVPSAGSQFSGWGGECASTMQSICIVTMSPSSSASSDKGDKTVSATFTPGSPPEGAADLSFGTNGVVLTQVGSSGDGAQAVARQSDGKLLVVGQGTDGSSNMVTKVARYTSSGALDTTFGHGGSGITTIPSFPKGGFDGHAVGLAPDGDILVGGTITSMTQPAFGVVRLKAADGSVDTSFGDGGLAEAPVGDNSTSTAATSMVVDPVTGDMYVGGTGAQSMQDVFALVAFQPDGATLGGFGSYGVVLTDVGDSHGQINGLALDGSSVVAAGFASVSGILQPQILRYSAASGAIDTTFNGGSPVTAPLSDGSHDGGAYGVIVQSDDKLLLGGFGGFSGWSGGSCHSIARLNSDGSADSSFGTGGGAHWCVGQDGAATAIALGSAGAYLAGHEYDGSHTHITLVRFTTGGALDHQFGNGGIVSDPIASSQSSQANAITLDGANPVVAGLADAGASTMCFVLERYLG